MYSAVNCRLRHDGLHHRRRQGVSIHLLVLGAFWVEGGVVGRGPSPSLNAPYGARCFLTWGDDIPFIETQGVLMLFVVLDAF